MKKGLLLTCAALITKLTLSQTPSCCSPTETFASLADDPGFVAMHEDPIPFTYISENGSMITFPCADGTDANAFLLTAKKQTNKYLFVFHEWWGLNDYIKRMSEKLYNDLDGKVNVIAIDLYDGKVATTQEDAKTYLQSLTPERTQAITNGAIAYAGKKAEIATIGWCAGGGYSMQASLLATTHAIGCVMYYGMPESDPEKLKNLQADVFMVWANQDKWITKDVVDQFEANMTAAGKKLEVKEYTADHGFANPSSPKYNQAATADAYPLVLNFLKEKLE